MWFSSVKPCCDPRREFQAKDNIKSKSSETKLKNLKENWKSFGRKQGPSSEPVGPDVERLVEVKFVAQPVRPLRVRTRAIHVHDYKKLLLKAKISSVADPDPNPDPRFFGPPGSGSGSISQRQVWIRIRVWILLSLSKNSKENLDFYCFVTSFWLFTFEKCCKSTFKK